MTRAGTFDGWFLPPGARADGETPVGLPNADWVRRLEWDPAAARMLLDTLRGARADALLGRTAAERARMLGRAGARFLDPADPLRIEAEARVAADSKLSTPMARAVIQGMARDWTAERLQDLLTAELPDARALEEFVTGVHGARTRAFGPELALHVGSGTVPGVSATSLLRSLLVGSATLVKPGAGDVVLPVLLARALAEEAPELARACAVVYWEGGADDALEQAAIADADLIVAYGGDATVRALRERAPATTPVLAYHHRVSVALVGRGALRRTTLIGVADDLARAVAMFDQRGCVSPHAVFVERGGEIGPEELAAALAAALGRVERELPPGAPDPAQASDLHQLRRTAELRAAAGEPVVVHAGAGWTVLLEPPAELELSCLGRTVRVHPVDDARVVPALLERWRRHLQTVGVAGLDDRLGEVAEGLGRAGATRICGLADVAFPPPWWHHDGRGPLTSLLRWVDLEG
ncbi:MAG: hypothetical protein EXR95_01505 [Gemmatimonadetes bacterium]|nr:hypothetical protein [Gemmatimonadota bacterium]